MVDVKGLTGEIWQILDDMGNVTSIELDMWGNGKPLPVGQVTICLKAENEEEMVTIFHKLEGKTRGLNVGFSWPKENK